jgi:hypothetical protein
MRVCSNIKCRNRASYSYRGKPVYCGRHKKYGMINAHHILADRISVVHLTHTYRQKYGVIFHNARSVDIEVAATLLLCMRYD